MVGKLFFANSIFVRVLAKTSSSGMSVLDQLSLGSSFVVLSELGAKEWGAPSLLRRDSVSVLSRVSCLGLRLLTGFGQLETGERGLFCVRRNLLRGSVHGLSLRGC